MREFFPSIEIENGSRLIYSSAFVYKVPPTLFRSCINHLINELPFATIDEVMNKWLTELSNELQKEVIVSEQLI